MLLLALCRLLRDNYSIAVVTSHTAPDQDSSREFLIRHKALASTRIAAVDRGRHIEGAIESLMTEFRPELIFLEAADSDREPVGTYSKEQITTYLRFCREKAIAVLAAETEESLAAPARFGRPISRLELHVYNIRHVQHHAAQLILKLRLEAGVDIPWVGSGWRE